MNVLDWLLLVVAFAYGLSGYWQGFVAGLFAMAGLLVGGFAGIHFAPLVFGSVEPSMAVTIGALGVVIVCALVGQAVFQLIGSKVRGVITWRPARLVDHIGGAVLSVVAVLVITWSLGVAAVGMQIPRLSAAVRESAVLSAVDAALPEGSDRLLSNFDGLGGVNLFPSYLDPFEPEQIVSVAPVIAGEVSGEAVDAAAASVVKVHGTNSCNRGVEGTGFVVRSGYVVTNAHVVAGVTDPRVSVGGVDTPATVVAYDPAVDVAMLHLDTGGLDSVALESSTSQEQPVAVMGFPQDGPFTVTAARIRSVEQLRSTDIYGTGSVVRQVLALRGVVKPGNSGGPVVDADGRVVGVVFAASLSDTETGYALTADQVRPFIDDALGQVQPVATGDCTGG